MGGYVGRPSTAVHRGIAMAVRFARRTLVVPALVIVVHTAALAQTAAAPARSPAGPTGTTAAWTLKLTGDVRWQQVTPAGALLVSTDAALAGVDIDRGQVLWEKADLGGLPTDSVRLVEGSLLVEAARPGLLVILDPVTGAVLFDSRRPGLTQIVTRRVLPQSGTLLVHGRRANGPAVVALYDLVTGEQRWVPVRARSGGRRPCPPPARVTPRATCGCFRRSTRPTASTWASTTGSWPTASRTVRRCGPSPRPSTAGCTASCSTPTGSSFSRNHRPPIRPRATCAS